MSGNRNDETVDVFGRTVVVTGSPRNNGRTVVAPAGNPGHRDVKVTVDNTNQHRRVENNRDGNRHRDDSRGRGGRDNIRYQEKEAYDNNRRRQSGGHSASRIPPILSFKTFAHNHQNAGHAQDVLERMYDEYHQNYLQEFSDSFFRASMMEEWFQDRYNPIRIRDQDKAIAARAAVESAAIKASLLAQPVDTVKAMCLDPSTVATTNRLRAQSTADAAAAPAATEDTTENENVDVSAMESSSSVPLADRALSGHTDRTLYISGIHAGCTKLALQNSITAALAATTTDATAAAVPAPERIILAQPMWTVSDGVNKFERFAWVVMPTVESAKAALTLLFNLRVVVHAPVDPEQRDPVIALNFSVHARPHLPKQYFEKHEHCGHHLRIQADLGRALELASLLDELRDVPAELRLATILEEPSVVEALVKPTDKLDVTIAYLRRAHLVNYYGARKYRDESQLLQYAPSVLLREKEYVPLPEPVEGAMEEEAAAEEVAAPSIGSKRKHRDEEEGGAEEGEAEESSAEAEAGAAPAAADVAEDGMEVEAAAPAVPAARATKKFPQVATSNPRVEAILVELRALVAAKEQRAADPDLPGTAEEEEAKVLTAQQEKTFDRCVETRLSQEKEGKCRCCYVSCAKLFKGLDFLTKHMHLKHEDFAMEELLADAEPFLRKRFEADPMNARPLPPVEVEMNNRTELRSIREMLAKHRTAAQQVSSMNNRRGDRDYAQGNDNNANRRGGVDNRGGNANNSRRGQDDRDRRVSGGGGPGNHQAPQKMHYVEPRSEDNHARKISSYIDVDAPKESAVSIDYGVALPPIKKRKTVTTPKKVA